MYASETEKRVIDLLNTASSELDTMKDNIETIDDKIQDYLNIFDYDGEILGDSEYDDLNYTDDNELKNKITQLVGIHNRLETVIKEYENKIAEIF